MIKAKALSKSYKKNILVLKSISINIQKGKISAILGPNASGKTTFIKCLLGLVRPNAGEIIINGESILDRWDYRENIGFVPQTAHYPESLKIRELRQLLVDIKGRSTGLDNELWDDFNLGKEENKLIREVSGGTRQKLNVAMAFLFSPSLYIFDEPTVGLDPVAAQIFRDKLIKENKKGATVLFTTHILKEVDGLADNIIFLLEGAVQFEGTKDALLSQMKEANLESAIIKLMKGNV